MKFDLFAEPPIEMRRQHKDVCYTIKLIGGPEEYKAYMKEKAIRLEAAKLAQHEAYVMKRGFYEDIALGHAEASPEALREPETLARFKAQMTGKPVQQYIKTDGILYYDPSPPSPPRVTRMKTWIKKWFKKT